MMGMMTAQKKKRLTQKHHGHFPFRSSEIPSKANFKKTKKPSRMSDNSFTIIG